MDINFSEITTSASYSDINQDFVVSELQKTYWASDRKKEDILLSLTHSFCYSIFLRDSQIGFARVITDHSTFAYLCDVIVHQDYRSKGIGKKMLNDLFNIPHFKNLRWILRTKDAQGLYQKFGFTQANSERVMEKNFS